MGLCLSEVGASLVLSTVNLISLEFLGRVFQMPIVNLHLEVH